MFAEPRSTKDSGDQVTSLGTGASVLTRGVGGTATTQEGTRAIIDNLAD